MRVLSLPIDLSKNLLRLIGGLGYLLLDTARATRLALFSKRGRRLGWSNLWAQMDRVGVQSIPIVSLVLFCIGAILALQMAPTLDSFGLVDSRAQGEPRYYVLFDHNPRLIVNGLRLGGLGELRVPDERIIDRAFEFAKSVWQLKDRLKLLQKKLDKAVAEENFELAAQLRDELKQFKEKSSQPATT